MLVQPKGLRGPTEVVSDAERECAEDVPHREREGTKGIQLGVAMGDNSLPTTMYKVVYILRRHEVTVCKECNESRTESEGLRMRPSVDDHPPGLSLGSECFGVLRRVSDLGSNVAGIRSLHRSQPHPDRQTEGAGHFKLENPAEQERCPCMEQLLQLLSVIRPCVFQSCQAA